MTKNIKYSLIFLILISVGFVIGHYHGADTMEKFSSDFMKEMEAELYYQSFEKHKEIYSALDKKDYKKAQSLLEKRMSFELMVIGECIESNCLKMGISDVTKEWLDKNRSNKSLNQIGAKDAPPG